MHPFDAAPFLSAPLAEGSSEPPQQLVGAASSPSSSPSRVTRAAGGNAGISRQDGRHPRAKQAYRARCFSSRGSVVCPGHVTTSSDVPASQQCSERQQTTPAVVVDVEPISKRPRRAALPSVAAASSSVDQPIARTTALGLERFAREVRLDAVFRRVRLGGPAAEPEIAYYTTVTIAGHVFRGVLYDVGPHSHSGSTSASDTDGSGEGSSLTTAGDSCLDLTLGL